MRSFASFVLLLVSMLASRVYALNITIVGLGVIPATEFLNTTDTTVMNNCTTECTPGMGAISDCTTDQCLCDMATIMAVTACEQCMFTELIALNANPKDPRTGSSTALTAYAAACLASVNVTVPTTATTLTLPSNWDGPFGLDVGTAGTVITLIVGLGLGGSAFGILNTM